MLDDLKYIHTHDPLDMVGTTAKQAAATGMAVESWLSEVPTARNLAKQIALELIGKPVIITAGPKLYPAAVHWKEACNTHAGHLAWAAELTDAEVLGWTKQPVDKLLAVVELRSSLEAQQTRRRFAVAERWLSGRRPVPVVVASEGVTLQEQLAWSMALGDFVSIYLALLAGNDPAAVKTREKFKQEMEKDI